MPHTDKNIFSKEVRKELIDRGWTIKHLATVIKRPRESVSRAINSTCHPLIRLKVARKLNLTHLVQP